LIPKAQSTGLSLSIAINYHQRIRISHNHTLIGDIQTILAAKSKPFLCKIHPLPVILFQISFHRICIFSFQPWKNIESGCCQPVISIDLRPSRILNRNCGLHLRTIDFPEIISPGQFQCSLYSINTRKLHIDSRNIPQNRNMQGI